MSDETDSKISKEANGFMASLVPILVGVLFTLVGVIYAKMNNADAYTMDAVKEIQSHQTSDTSRFQNLEGNVYLLCKAQRLATCLPPELVK